MDEADYKLPSESVTRFRDQVVAFNDRLEELERRAPHWDLALERIDRLQTKTPAPPASGLPEAAGDLHATTALAIAAARIALNLLAKISKDPGEVDAITEELNGLIEPLEG